MTRILTPLFASATAFLMMGCGNPADNVNEAAVSDSDGTAPAEASAEATLLDIAETSTIDFTGSKVTGKHDGGFKSFEGQLAVEDGALVAAGSKVTIDMDSTWSDNEKLTGHLKSADFFDVENHPETTFVISGVETVDGTTTITGDLTLHGVTKTISFPAEVTVSEGTASLKAEFFLKRFDFGIVYPGKADDLIRDEVVIKLDVTAGA